MCFGTESADAGRHQDRTGEDRRSFDNQFLGIQSPITSDAFNQAIERHLLHDKSRIETIAVNMMWIPLTKMIIGPFVCRLIEIVRAWIDGQLFHAGGIKIRLPQYLRVGLVQQLDALGDNRLVFACGGTDLANKDRYGPDPFVRIGLDLLRFKRRHGTIANEVVNARDGSVQDVGIFAFAINRQEGFDGPPHEQTVDDFSFGLML